MHSTHLLVNYVWLKFLNLSIQLFSATLLRKLLRHTKLKKAIKFLHCGIAHNLPGNHCNLKILSRYCWLILFAEIFGLNKRDGYEFEIESSVAKICLRRQQPSEVFRWWIWKLSRHQVRFFKSQSIFLKSFDCFGQKNFSWMWRKGVEKANPAKENGFLVWPVVSYV